MKTKTKTSARTKTKKKPTRAEKLAAEIARRNKLFAAASPAEKRVLIAKDVLAQIRTGNVIPQLGTWVRAARGGDLRVDFGDDAPVRELMLDNKLGQCSCCALGAMFMSCTLYNNKTTAQDFEYELNQGSFDYLVERRGSLSNGLNTFFSPAQLKLIEIYFEFGEGAFCPRNTREDNNVTLWYETYPTAKSRLRAIMQNIIDNDGTFKP